MGRPEADRNIEAGFGVAEVSGSDPDIVPPLPGLVGRNFRTRWLTPPANFLAALRASRAATGKRRTACNAGGLWNGESIHIDEFVQAE
jgi:hypothetical protein